VYIGLGLNLCSGDDEKSEFYFVFKKLSTFPAVKENLVSVKLRLKKFKTFVEREYSYKETILKFFVRDSNQDLILFTEFSTPSPPGN
jgi:hypothetical protein